MYLEKITLINFKNYEQLDLELSPKINCFVGNNGAGKTNLLDAVHYLSFCKSYFNPIDSQNIRYSADFFMIQGQFFRLGEQENIYCGVKRNKKKNFKRNKKPYRKFSEHIGLIPVVIITPNDTALILEGSEERRKFIDGIISQYDKTYLEKLIRYNRALNQRNQLLKAFAQNNKFDATSIEVWDEQLADLGQYIYLKRVDFIDKLLPIFKKYYELISLQAENINLTYQSQLHKQNLKSLLKTNRKKDLTLEYTSVGAHRDDLNFSIEGHALKKNASQGQQKTFLIALKLAQYDFIKEVIHFEPVLLLDDIFDKLDKNRVEQILKLLVDNHFGQIFFTDTNQQRLENILNKVGGDYSVFYIEEGKIIAKNGTK